jgi:hypothetical protein
MGYDYVNEPSQHHRPLHFLLLDFFLEMDVCFVMLSYYLLTVSLFHSTFSGRHNAKFFRWHTSVRAYAHDMIDQYRDLSIFYCMIYE